RPIALIAGTYYDLTLSPITVPGGVTDAPVTLQINDSDLTNNYGSYDLCVQVTNNAQPNWQQTFNFNIADNGWSPVVGGYTAGTWSAGTGWIETDDHNPPANDVYYRRLFIHRAFTATNIVSIEIRIDWEGGFIQTSGDIGFRVRR